LQVPTFAFPFHVCYSIASFYLNFIEKTNFLVFLALNLYVKMRLLLAGDKESNPGPQMTSYLKGTWLERYILTYSVLIVSMY